jgi:hypothetical protein
MEVFYGTYNMALTSYISTYLYVLHHCLPQPVCFNNNAKREEIGAGRALRVRGSRVHDRACQNGSMQHDSIAA